MALPKNNRLRRKRDFDAVFRHGKTVAGSFLFTKTIISPLPQSRFGIVISSRVAKTAVLRNRIRRLLGESIRNHLPNRVAYDTVIVVTRTAPELVLLQNDLLATLKKTKIL